MYTILANIKGIVRYLLCRIRGAEFFAYSDAARTTSGYNGWYEVGGKVVAFQRSDGSVQYAW